MGLSVSESTDSAIARIIVSDPERVQDHFNQNNVAFGISEVVVVELQEVATQLGKLFSALFMQLIQYTPSDFLRRRRILD